MNSIYSKRKLARHLAELEIRSSDNFAFEVFDMVDVGTRL